MSTLAAVLKVNKAKEKLLLSRKSFHPLWKEPVPVLRAKTQAHLERPVKTLK